MSHPPPSVEELDTKFEHNKRLMLALLPEEQAQAAAQIWAMADQPVLVRCRIALIEALRRCGFQIDGFDDVNSILSVLQSHPLVMESMLRVMKRSNDIVVTSAVSCQAIARLVGCELVLDQDELRNCFTAANVDIDETNEFLDGLFDSEADPPLES